MGTGWAGLDMGLAKRAWSACQVNWSFGSQVGDEVDPLFHIHCSSDVKIVQQQHARTESLLSPCSHGGRGCHGRHGSPLLYVQ